jgi:hypothetical protein
MKTPWDIYKEKVANGEVTPVDLLKKENYTTSDISDARYEICKVCDRFNHITTQCKECGCVMKLKTKLEHATCPLNLWK